MIQYHPINIHTQGKKLNLPKGKYHIHIIGGWSVTENAFLVRFIRELDGETIHVSRASWPLQGFEFGKRSKRYFEFEIKQSGVYLVELIHPKTLVVKKSNLFPFNLLQKPVDNATLSILIF